MLVKKAADIRSSEITDKKLYVRRREFIQAAAITAVGAAAGTLSAPSAAAAPTWPRVKIPNVRQVEPPLTSGEKPNSYQDITTYNNFYEFGTEKDDPSNNAGSLKTKPWTIKVDGLVDKPLELTMAFDGQRHRLRLLVPVGRQAIGYLAVDGDQFQGWSANSIADHVQRDAV